MRSARGFTLIELMISMALAGLIVAGAMQMHISFNRQSQRQNQVAEMQQNLRVSMLLLERAIRSAGHGIDNGVLIERASGLTGASCPITPVPNTAPPAGPPVGPRGNYGVKHYAFQWYDKNAFTGALTTAAATDGTAATIDPDWFQVMTAADTPPIYAIADTASGLQILDNSKGGGVVPDLSAFADGDLFQIAFPLSDTTGCKVGKATGQDCSTWKALMGCYREISKGTNFGGASSPKYIKHDPTNSKRCYNPPIASDDCTASLSAAHRAVIRHIDGWVTQYRVLPIGDASNPTATPKLAMRRAPYGDYTTTYPWQIIADNIENMQLALVMTDGNICYNIDDPAVCEPARAAAVRISLVARSEAEVAGYRDGWPLRYENEAGNVNVTTPRDGYLRRAVTAQIELRNMPAQNYPALP